MRRQPVLGFRRIPAFVEQRLCVSLDVIGRVRAEIEALEALHESAYVPLGDHMARVFTSPRHLRVERIDKKRPHHYWLAPDRDYIPVRIEQFKSGKRELLMELAR